MSVMGATDDKKIAHLNCNHGIAFDEDAATIILSKAKKPESAVDFIMGPIDATTEIRKRWPRGCFTNEKPCSKCGYVGIYYASWAHYTMGDW